MARLSKLKFSDKQRSQVKMAVEERHLPQFFNIERDILISSITVGESYIPKTI